MLYRIVGAHRETGADMDVVVEAATPSAAEEAAGQMNLMVERIELVSSPPEPPARAQPATAPAVHVVQRPPSATGGRFGKASLLLAALSAIFVGLGAAVHGAWYLLALPLGAVGLLCAVIGFFWGLATDGKGVWRCVGAGILGSFTLLVLLLRALYATSTALAESAASMQTPTP